MTIVPLYIDTETFSSIPLTRGTHKYAEKVSIMLFAFARGDGPVTVRDLTNGERIPDEFFDTDIPLVIHNSAFDRTVISRAIGFNIPTSRIIDTMVRARTLGLPGGLDILCDILKVPFDKAKGKRGKELIQLFCKPRPENDPIRRATRETHPAEWQQFIDYARLDIEAMRAIHHMLPSWNHRDREFTLWQLDQKINDRGMRVDTELAEAAIRAVGDTKRVLDADTSEATSGYVESATQRDKLLRFILGTYGIELPNMQASTLERRIDDPDLPQGLKELLNLRLQTSTTSTAKYKTLLDIVNSDGRMRGTQEFCGAGRTGRWSGRKFQPHNLPSRNLPPQEDIDRCISLLKNDCADLVYDNLMKMISACVRGCIIASRGQKLVVSDLRNIEGRVAAWLAGEKWKLQAFRDFDSGVGWDLYILSYARTFNIRPEDVTKHQRQIGKVMELMLQYGGGVGAFITGAASYGIDLDAMADAAWDGIPAAILKEAKSAWKWAVDEMRTFGLKAKTYVVCDALKRMWREAHPAISAYWKKSGESIRAAIQWPNTEIACGNVKIIKTGSWLRIILPSGRSLCYASVRLEDDKISYMGMHQYSRKWIRLNTYDGKVFENECQAVARDVIAHNMPAIELAGYEQLFLVHDEDVTEAPDNDNFSAEALSALLCTNPDWAPDMPLAAGGYESYRYRKG